MPGRDGSRAISTIKFLLVSRSYSIAAAAAHYESWQQQVGSSAAVLLAHLITGCTPYRMTRRQEQGCNTPGMLNSRQHAGMMPVTA